MEPQLEGCGKLTEAAQTIGKAAALQWSRNLRVAERPKGGIEQKPQIDASMEPQLEGCGKTATRRSANGYPARFNGAAT